MKRNKNKKRYDADMAALETALGAHRVAFLRALAAGDGTAAATWEAGQERLTRPQRICTEAFAVGGESFEQIAERTGYLLADIEAHIAAATRTLVPEETADNQEPAIAQAADNQELVPAGEAIAPAEHSVIRIAEPAEPEKTEEPAELAKAEEPTKTEEPAELAKPVKSTKSKEPQEPEESAQETDNKPFEAPPRMSRRSLRQTLDGEQDDEELRPRHGLRWLKVVGVAVGMVVALGMVVVIISVLTRGELVPRIDEPPADIPAEVVEGGGDYAQPDYNHAALPADTLGADSTAVAAAAADSTATAALPLGASSGRRAELAGISREADGQPTSKPLIGRREYNDYLAAAAMVLPADARGEVTMTFKVNDYGRPSQIRVTSTFSREANHEALRLLSNGPEWTESQRIVTLTIRFN